MTNWLDVQVFPVLLCQVNWDAYKYGNAYVATGLDDENNMRIYRQDSRQCAVMYDPVQPDRIMTAFKLWQDPISGLIMLNIVTRWATYHFSCPKSKSVPKLASFVPYEEDGAPAVVDHAVQGICPFWHFPNDSDAAGQGSSALRDCFLCRTLSTKRNAIGL